MFALIWLGILCDCAGGGIGLLANNRPGALSSWRDGTAGARGGEQELRRKAPTGRRLNGGLRPGVQLLGLGGIGGVERVGEPCEHAAVGTAKPPAPAGCEQQPVERVEAEAPDSSTTRAPCWVGSIRQSACARVRLPTVAEPPKQCGASFTVTVIQAVRRRPSGPECDAPPASLAVELVEVQMRVAELSVVLDIGDEGVDALGRVADEPRGGDCCGLPLLAEVSLADTMAPHASASRRDAWRLRMSDGRRARVWAGDDD